MKLGRGVTRNVFESMDKGYEGAVANKEGRKYRFVGYRKTNLHGLFGIIEYKRAYYFSQHEGGGGYFPLDEKLGIEKRHTPGCQYFLASFKLGIVGSALGTILVLGYYLSGRSLLKQRATNFMPRREIVMPILAIGSAVMNGVMNNQLERYGGDSAVTAMSIVFAISNLVYLTLLGITIGFQPIIGYNIGAKLSSRVRKAELLGIATATVFTTLCYIAVQLFPIAVVSLFASPASHVVGIGVYAFRHYFFAMPLLYILPLFAGLDGVWNAQPLSDALSFSAKVVCHTAHDLRCASLATAHNPYLVPDISF